MNVPTIEEMEILELAAWCADNAKFSMHCVRASKGYPSQARWLQSAKNAGRDSDFWSLEAERPFLGYPLRRGRR